jgi:hypothetical protein
MNRMAARHELASSAVARILVDGTESLTAQARIGGGCYLIAEFCRRPRSSALASRSAGATIGFVCRTERRGHLRTISPCRDWEHAPAQNACLTAQGVAAQVRPTGQTRYAADTMRHLTVLKPGRCSALTPFGPGVEPANRSFGHRPTPWCNVLQVEGRSDSIAVG